MSVQHMYDMKRTTIWLTDPQRSKLKALSRRTGIQIAELIRRFIDEGLRKQK
jgi:predicted DNA-binding protein